MKLKDVDFEMKFIGWNMGQYGHEREQRACGIEILEMKIDDVDILKELDKIEAIKTNLTNMVGILETDLIHRNTMIKIEYAQELLKILEDIQTSEDTADKVK